MKRLKQRLNGRMLTYLAALTLMLAVMMTTAGTFAAYRSSNAGGGAARVAGFEVEMVAEDNVVSISTEEDRASYTFAIINQSEVAVKYSIEMHTANALPKGIQFTMGETTHETDGSKVNFVFPGGNLATGEREEYNLSVVTDKNVLIVDVRQEVSVRVIAEQID